MTQKKFTELAHTIFRELYANSTPKGDWDEMLKNAKSRYFNRFGGGTGRRKRCKYAGPCHDTDSTWLLDDNLLREGYFLNIYGRSPGYEVSALPSHF